MSELNELTLHDRFGREVAALALFALGRTRLNAGDSVEAASCFEELLQRRADIPNEMVDIVAVQYWAARAYRDAGRKHEALAVLASAIATNPRYVDARELRAEIYSDGGDVAAALTDLLATIGPGRRDGIALLRIGDLYSAKRPELALMYYQLAARVNPSCTRCMQRQDELRRRQTRRTEARLL